MPISHVRRVTTHRIHPAGMGWRELKQTMELLFGCRNGFNSSKSRSIRKACSNLRTPEVLFDLLPLLQPNRRPRRRWLAKLQRLILSSPVMKSKKVPLHLKYILGSKFLPPRLNDFMKAFPPEDFKYLCLPLPSNRDSLSGSRSMAPLPTRLIWAYSEFPYFGQRLRELRLQSVYLHPLASFRS